MEGTADGLFAGRAVHYCEAIDDILLAENLIVQAVLRGNDKALEAVPSSQVNAGCEMVSSWDVTESGGRDGGGGSRVEASAHETLSGDVSTCDDIKTIVGLPSNHGDSLGDCGAVTS